MSEADAAASIRRFLNMLKGLTELEPELTSLASIKQATQEAVNRADLARVKEEEANKALVSVLEQITKAKSEAQNLTTIGKKDYEAAIARGEAEAKQLIAQAKSTVEQFRRETMGELESIEAKIREAKSTLEALETEISSAQARYSDIQSKVDSIVRSLGR